jgi:hypothetical protein
MPPWGTPRGISLAPHLNWCEIMAVKNHAVLFYLLTLSVRHLLPLSFPPRGSSFRFIPEARSGPLSNSVGPTTHAEPHPLAQSEPTIQAPARQSRPLAPLDLANHAEVTPKIPKMRTTSSKSTRPGRSTSVDADQGRAGGLSTLAGTGQTGTRMARCHPPKIRAVLFPSEEGFQ